MGNRVAKILAIDDNQDNLTILQALIDEVLPGTVVLLALNGQKGLEIAAKEEPDVILLDIVMPGMDGYEVCRRIKGSKELCEIPVVFITAIESDRESRVKAIECGAEAFITKPIDESELTVQIRAMLKIRMATIEKRYENDRLTILVEEKNRDLEKVYKKTLKLVDDLRKENLAREKSQSDLLKSETKYRQITENMSDVIWTVDKNMRITYISPSVKMLLGESPEAYIGKTFEKKLAPDSYKEMYEVLLEEFEKAKNEKKDEGRLRKFEVPHYRANGSAIWISMHVSIMRDENGKVIGCQGVSRDISERKHAEDELKLNMKDLMASQRIAHIGTWRLDLATNQVVWTEELYRIFGLNPKLPPPDYTAHMKLFTPESWNRLSTSLENTRTTGIPYELELETVNIDGSNGWMWVRGEVETDSEGSTIALWGVAQDITAQKKSEFLIRQSEERFQLLFNRAPLGYQSLDSEGRFIDVNQQWLDTLGYNKKEVIGKWFGDFLCPQYVDAFRQRFPIFLSQGYIHSEFEMLRKDGQQLNIAFEGKIGYDSDGEFVQTHCILQDITKQTKIEKDLIESEERHKCLFENSGVGIGYYTKDGVVISYNKKALDNIGGKLEDYIGKSIRELFSEEEAEEYSSRIEKTISSDQPQVFEDCLALKSGPKWFVSTFTKVINSIGEVTGVQIASLDVTERKLAEEALLESQAALKAALENSQAGIVIADAPDGKIRYANKAGLMIRDKSEDELVKGVNVHNYVTTWGIMHFDGTPYTENEFPLTRAVLYGETCSEEFVIRRDNSENRYVMANAAPIKDSNNNVKAAIVVFLDVTDRIKAEMDMRTQNELFASLLKLLPVGVFMVDAADGKPLVVNDMGKALLGSGMLPNANEDNLSKLYKAYKVDTGKYYPTAEMPIVLGMRGISSHIDDMEVERPDGTRILLDVLGTPVKDNEGKPWASLVAFMDITERKKAEDELSWLMAQNQRIIDNLQDSYFQSDLHGRIVKVNPQAVHMYGYSSASELIGLPGVLLYANPDDRMQMLDDLKNLGEVADSVIEGLRKDGTAFWVSMNVQFVKDEQNCILGTESVVRDISERIQLINEIELQRDDLFAVNTKLAHLLEQSVEAISRIGELRDVYTAGHQRRVRDLACAIAKQLGLSDDAIVNLSYAALIHDIGKIYIASDILNKPGKISNLEYQIIQTHVEQGYNVIKEVDFPDVISAMVSQHHERLDGSGYPQGLSGEQIIIESRILAVADVVEAMTSHRPYRPALGIDAALEEISTYRGKRFDCKVVDTCVRLFREEGFKFDA